MFHFYALLSSADVLSVSDGEFCYCCRGDCSNMKAVCVEVI